MTAYPMLHTDRARIVNEAVWFACKSTYEEVRQAALDAGEHIPASALHWLSVAENYWHRATYGRLHMATYGRLYMERWP